MRALVYGAVAVLALLAPGAAVAQGQDAGQRYAITEPVQEFEPTEVHRQIFEFVHRCAGEPDGARGLDGVRWLAAARIVFLDADRGVEVVYSPDGRVVFIVRGEEEHPTLISFALLHDVTRARGGPTEEEVGRCVVRVAEGGAIFGIRMAR